MAKLDPTILKEFKLTLAECRKLYIRPSCLAQDILRELTVRIYWRTFNFLHRFLLR